MAERHDVAPGISLEVASRTDLGLEREENQDTLLLALLSGAVVAGVCDGMGGAAGGQVASSQAAAVIEEQARAYPMTTVDGAGHALFRAIEQATRTVYAHSLREPHLRGMGTTATIAAIVGDHVVVAQVGDSRAYLCRRGVLTQLTRDQTLAQQLVESGQLAPHEVATFPHANVILQAVGTTEHVDVDLRCVRLCQDDVLLVCSDGLHGPVGNALAAKIVSEATSLDEACASLIGQALAVGGPDNITCVLARATGSALAVATSGEVDVTQCVLEPAPPGASPTDPQVPEVTGKVPLSNLWPLRWGPWASKKTP